ncbi:phage tail tube protein [Pararhizobium sp. YC-54]|uniref:phage tail tube protein n=1 Tax=Pararhizobium sp. YC-54 TaxID=2986920 RepID=UPI0021F7DD64|nr:phage tail tube protein [Pararhizobium sp. YC-54]MCV9997327.1 phage tail tube protein [Pararhizobium sp. YC-54]
MAGSDTNRVRMTVVREEELGVTPDTPRMRAHRFTGEGLQYQPSFVQSEEIRDDRMNSDPTKVNETSQGPINGELSYPVDGSPLSMFLESLFFNPWDNTPQRDNDGTADSVITGVAATGGVITVTAGEAFAVGHLIRTSGFAQSGNNGLFKITTGSTTVPAVGNAILTDEAAPAAGARVKVVGFEGASGDITAVADGLSSTTLNFTTLGLSVGQWVKIGGAGAAYRYAAAALNGWARIIDIAANKLTLDNLPTGWATNTGAGKTIRVFFGDTIKNGVTMFSHTIERGWLGQTVPSYIIQRGMVTGQGEFTFASEALATYVLTQSGLTGEVSDASLDDVPEPVTTNRTMAAAVNVGRIAENGVQIGGPNFVRSLGITINNNLRMLNAIRSDEQVGPVDIGTGSCDVTVTMETYFGSKVLLDKLFNSTPTNINARISKDGQALIYGVPRLTFTEGSTSAGGKNQDSMLPLTAMASKDTLTGAHILLDRLEYFEA